MTNAFKTARAERAEVIAKKVTMALDECEDIDMSLMVLGSIAATILCLSFNSEDEALKNYDTFVNSIADCVVTCRDKGVTSWQEGTPH